MSDYEDGRTCRCCGVLWQPDSWNFWDLCDECYPKWRAIRVQPPSPAEYERYIRSKGYYTADSYYEWINAGCPPPPDEPFESIF